MLIRKAVIMAGGEGQRMQPVSNYLPKCYLPIFDEPLLIKQIHWLVSAGIKELTIAVDDKFGHIITTLLSVVDLEQKLSIDVVIEEKAMGIGHALLGLKQKVGNDPFVFLLGDEYYKRPKFFSEIKKMKKPDNILGVTEYTDVDSILQGCNLKLDEDKKLILELIEKPRPETIVSKWCWNGAAVFNTCVLEELESVCGGNSKKDNNILIQALNNLIKNGVQLFYFLESNENVNLTSVEDYYKAFLIEYQTSKGV